MFFALSMGNCARAFYHGTPFNGFLSTRLAFSFIISLRHSLFRSPYYQCNVTYCFYFIRETVYNRVAVKGVRNLFSLSTKFILVQMSRE